MSKFNSPQFVEHFFKEIYRILRDTDKKVNEIWYERSEIPNLKGLNKFELSEFLGNFDFIEIKRGNHIDYIAIDKVLFVADAIQYLEIELKKLSELLDFNGFEALIQEILLRNEYKVIKNFRFSDKSNFKSKTSQTRYEVDVIGFNRKYILVIDAKQWRRKDSFSSMNKAANLQYQRVVALKKNPNAFSELIHEVLGFNVNIKKNLPYKLIPMMVSIEDNGIRLNEKQVPLVSISNFNTFLQEFYKYVDNYKTINISKVSIQTRLL